MKTLNKENFENFLTNRNDHIDNAFFNIAQDIASKKTKTECLLTTRVALATLSAEPNITITDDMCVQVINAATNITKPYITNEQQNLTWNMELISEIISASENILEKHNIAFCHPFFTENEQPCASKTNDCPYINICPFKKNNM